MAQTELLQYTIFGGIVDITPKQRKQYLPTPFEKEMKLLFELQSLYNYIFQKVQKKWDIDVDVNLIIQSWNSDKVIINQAHRVERCGVVYYIDELQAELDGTQSYSIEKRLEIHKKFLALLDEDLSIGEAVLQCRKMM